MEHAAVTLPSWVAPSHAPMPAHFRASLHLRDQEISAALDWLGYIDEPFVIPPQPVGQHRVTDESTEDKASFQTLPQSSNLEHGDVAILGGTACD